MTTRRKSFSIHSKKDWESLAIRDQFLTLKPSFLMSMGYNYLKPSFQQKKMITLLKAYPPKNHQTQMALISDFFKKCWPVIRKDFYDLCKLFFHHNICLRCINGTYITLIPKKIIQFQWMTSYLYRYSIPLSSWLPRFWQIDFKKLCQN